MDENLTGSAVSKYNGKTGWVSKNSNRPAWPVQGFFPTPGETDHPPRCDSRAALAGQCGGSDVKFSVASFGPRAGATRTGG